jgi:cell division protein FtsL
MLQTRINNVKKTINDLQVVIALSFSFIIIHLTKKRVAIEMKIAEANSQSLTY